MRASLKLHRRDMLKASVAGAVMGVAQGASAPLRAGIVGLGERGMALLDLALRFEGVEITALSDVDAPAVERARALVASRRRTRPAAYSGRSDGYQSMCERQDLDLVIAATPAALNTRVCLAAMQSGKHAASEPPAATTLDECWQLVGTSLKSGRHCVSLDSSAYRARALMLLNMFRAGVLGEPLFAEAAWVNGGEPAIAPVAWWMDLQRGDRCSDLVSCGSTLIRTERGRLICLRRSSGVPAPSEACTRVQGSKGCYSGTVNGMFIEGRSNRNEGPDWLVEPAWEELKAYEAEFRHKLWDEHGEAALASSEPGTYMLLRRLFGAISRKQAPDIDVYDSAAWSAIAPLADISRSRRRSVEFPDFTRGLWNSRPPLDAASLV